MNQVISYSKSIRALQFQLEESGAGGKEPLGWKLPQEIKPFADILKSNEPLRKVFRLVMDNLASFGSKNAVFFAEKLLTLTEKNPTAVYLLGRGS